ncbi:unnamed protein product [Adineta steineri]|uniref:Uncharacterized protein n=1 Tax=Adineta steineri TaxID=433720 RepID=A0A819K647_9BILA|nr:unnamed protein product [Adineta steineri]CAF3940460.1 unnamed protein product [Adineta steineri]
MNYLIENTTVTSFNISNLNVQSYGMELLSSTHNLIEQQNFNLNNNNPLYQAPKKKKISYGDRKVLIAKRRVRRQQERFISNQTNHLNQHIIKIDGDDQVNVRQEDEEEQQQRIHICPLNDHHQIRLSNKRKYQELNQDDMHINQLFSQLTITQEDLRKKKTLKRTRPVTYTVSF